MTNELWRVRLDYQAGCLHEHFRREFERLRESEEYRLPRLETKRWWISNDRGEILESGVWSRKWV